MLFNSADQSVRPMSSLEVRVQPFGGVLGGGAGADMRLRCPRNTVGDKDDHTSVGQVVHCEIILPGAPL